MKLRLIHTLFLLCIYLGINAQGESYPIYETLDSHVKGNNIGFKVAYYYSPQSLKDNEYEKSRDV